MYANCDEIDAEDCRGDPMQVLLWTSKSVRKLAGGLRERGHEARTTPDRAAQFRHINNRVEGCDRGRAAGDLDRHQEEGVDRRVLQRG